MQDSWFVNLRFDLIKDDSTIFERYPLETLAKKGELGAFKHEALALWIPLEIK